MKVCFLQAKKRFQKFGKLPVQLKEKLKLPTTLLFVFEIKGQNLAVLYTKELQKCIRRFSFPISY